MASSLVYPLRATTTGDLTGRIGKYEIVRLLGRGAMGVVYLARDTVLERDVALKVMVSNIADDPLLRERFEREAKAVARLKHPNVVNVFDLGRHTDDSPYMAMELLSGQDLKQTLAADPKMSLERRLGVIAQVLAGLAHAHEAGIVHRDIKPANVFIAQGGIVKIMDFGVARLGENTMTGGGGLVGTADYMSPEQVKGGRVDGRSDLFSVGCMLYELVIGEPPFRAGSVMAILYRISHEEASFARLPAGVAYEDLRPILAKALAKDPASRYQTTYELAADLARYLETHGVSPAGRRARQDLLRLTSPRRALPVEAEPAGVATPRTLAERGVPRGVRMAVGVGAPLLTALVVLVWILWPRPDPPPPRIEASVEPALGLRPTETPSPPPSPTPPPTAEPTKVLSRKERVNALLLRAGTELARNPRAAKTLYEQALALDPQNEVARQGHRAASAVVAASGEGPGTGRRIRSFVPGATRGGGPGKITFDARPASPGVDAVYSIGVVFRNESKTDVEIASLEVRTSINGRGVGGKVQPFVDVVGPRDSAVLRRMDGNIWRKDTERWSMEAKVTTSSGETYVAELVWK